MSKRGWLLFLAVGILWGTPYFFTRIAVREVDPIIVAFGRTAIGALILLPFAVRRGGIGKVLEHWKPALAFCVLEILGPWYLLADAGTRLPSSLSGLLVASVPILGFIASIAVKHETMGSWLRVVGLVVGLVGLVLLSVDEMRGGDAWPVIEVILTAIGYATAPIVASKYLRDVGSLELTACCVVFAALVFLPLAILHWPASVSAGPLWSVVWLGVVCTALTFVLFLQLIGEVGPSRAVVIAYLNPVVAVLLGVLILDEPFTATVVTAFVLVIVGSVLSTYTKREPRKGVEIEAPHPA